MLDEETNAEPRAVSASIADPYLLLVRDDSSVFIAQIDNSNELEEIEKPVGAISTTKWSSGCLYTDTTGVFQQSPSGQDGDKIMMFLLSSSGALHVRHSP
jgi:cleavage and polyadenylation specificity factor subunit 1